MVEDYANQNLMTLVTDNGERKYLNRKERRRFYRSRRIIKNMVERTFVELLYWTGCRVSEALEMVFARMNVHDSFVVIKTLKQHGKAKGKRFRIVFVPRFIMWRFNRVHKILSVQRNEAANQFQRLWNFGRQKAWRLVKDVMRCAKIFGAMATAKGLRHGFGVNFVMNNVALDKIQAWLGHRDIKTTSIYTKVSGEDDRVLARRGWGVLEVFA